MAYLELHDIHKSYFLGNNEFPVLKGISLKFERGEFVSILGESGGGKSTLMNIVGGLDRQFTGEVYVDGQLLDHQKEQQLDEYRRATVGHIYQAYNLIAHLTVLDNVMVPLDMTKLTNAEKRERAIKLLQDVGLSDQMNKHPNQLSGGQKQRVAIARALASDPQIIIADEPTGALDSKNTQEVLELLDQIAKDGKLVIAVTHSAAVANHGTRVVHLENGQVNNDERLKPAYPLPKTPSHIETVKMPAKDSYRLSFKHLMYNFARNSLIMIGVAIGLFSVMLFSGLGNGINGYIADQVNSMVNPQWIEVMKNPSGKKMNQEELMGAMRNMASNPRGSLISEQQLKRLEKVDGVSQVAPTYYLPAYQLSYKNKQQAGSGISTWSDGQRADNVKNGHIPHQGEMVLSKQEAAALMGAKNYKQAVGKRVNIRFNWVNKQGQPVAINSEYKVVGLMDGTGAGSYLNYRSVKKSLQAANAQTDVNNVSVKVKNLDDVDKVASRIENLRADNHKRIFGAITVGSMLKRINTYVHLASDVLAGVAGISLLVSALMIIVTMYMSVSERNKEIGILRALGGRKKDVRRLFTSESILIGLFGAVFALVITLLAMVMINHGFYSLIKYNIIQLTMGNVIFAFVAALVIAWLAALLPARRAANLNPIDALAAE